MPTYPSALLSAAHAAAEGQTYPNGALYVVATPIGNRADITLRALHVCSLVDAIACEDTRVSSTLLRYYGLDKPLLAIHGHNERQAAERVLERLARGQRIAYLSDAGTPAVSDPGAALVAAASAAGHRCIPIPGPSSAVAAVSVSGDVTAHGYRVVGFLPARGGQRGIALRNLANALDAQVVFEAPHRITALAAELATRCPARPLTLCRELTKQFETVVTLVASELPAWLAAQVQRTRGEFVLVLHAAHAAAEPIDNADQVLNVLLGELPLSQAVTLAMKLTAVPRGALYARALALKRAATI